MKTDRLEAFSDGVIAIIITIMVLEIKVPHSDNLAALRPLLPVLLSYVLSFVYVGIYWNNHHHLFQVAEKVTGRVLWANLHLLFWLSLLPFATGWMGENHFAQWPVALYGVPLFMAAVAYYILAQQLIRVQGCDSQLARAIGRDAKGLASVVMYLAAIALSFLNPWVGFGLYVAVAVLWFIPDRRIETQDNEDATHNDRRQTEPTAAAATGDGADGSALGGPAVGLGDGRDGGDGARESAADAAAGTPEAFSVGNGLGNDSKTAA